MKEPLFTWDNFKFLIKELVKCASNKHSYFSVKRVKLIIGWSIMEWGLVHWLVLNVQTITVTDILIWATANGLSSAYIMDKVQKEKKPNANDQTITT